MSSTKQGSDIVRTLGIDEPATGTSRKRLLVWVAMALTMAIGTAIWFVSDTTDEVQYKLEAARRSGLTVTVTATGNLEPTDQVQVGSELSGIIESVAVDYNDRVTVGQPLARLDTDKLDAQVLKSEAALDSAEAKVLEAKATVLETRLGLDRCEKLAERQMCAQQDVDTAQAAYSRAQAEEASAEAAVAEARATLDSDRTNLEKAVILSPINGIVLDRSVEPGQTVAASFQAPVLFILAEDLAQMELHVDVDEADVGQVKEGQTATFTVDAYPDRSFPAQITQIRFGSQEVDGVTTYETVMNVDNTDLSLRPGMTATAEITVEQIAEALLVPNAALRFAPLARSETEGTSGASLISQLLPRPPRAGSSPNEDASADEERQQVWALRDGQPVAVPVVVGTTDGIMTEVITGDIEPGMALIVDAITSGR